MKVIRASEIGEYLYCHRAWWLRHVRGYTSANVRELTLGTAAHAAHGRGVWMSTAFRVGAVFLLALAGIAFLISLVAR